MPAGRDRDGIAAQGLHGVRGTGEFRPTLLAELAGAGLGFSGAADVAHPLLGLIKVRHAQIVRL
jgi:hypothetical protein